jgi:replicative DNA helicase
MVFDALALNPALKVLIANVEMSASRLLDRQLARLSGVPLTLIRRHEVTLQEDLERIATGVARIQKVVGRLAFVQGPYTVERIAGAVDDSGADLIILDYIQRIDITGKFNGMRDKTNALMSKLREFADGGYGVIMAAALTRSKDNKGRSSDAGKHLSLASFRESGELEYGADDACLLYPTDPAASLDDPERPTTLAHVKSRDGETQTDLSGCRSSCASSEYVGRNRSSLGNWPIWQRNNRVSGQLDGSLCLYVC